MQKDKLLSVIVPTYNAEKYLEGCLKSICQQTYKRLEIILVDDGSMDGSGDICDKYALIDNRIKVIHKQNGGVSSARNAGLVLSKGELLAFVDADDEIELDMYETLVGAINAYDVDIASCGMIRENEYQPLKSTEASFEVYDVPLRQFYNDGLSVDCLWNKVFKKSCIQENFFDEGISYTEDQLFVAQCFEKATNIAIAKEIKYHYLQHNDDDTSITKKKGDFAFWSGHVRAMENIMGIIESNMLITLMPLAQAKYGCAIFSLFRTAISERDKKMYYMLKQRYSEDIKKFFATSPYGFGKMLSYYTYSSGYWIASIFHYYLKRKR